MTFNCLTSRFVLTSSMICFYSLPLFLFLRVSLKVAYKEWKKVKRVRVNEWITKEMRDRVEGEGEDREEEKEHREEEEGEIRVWKGEGSKWQKLNQTKVNEICKKDVRSGLFFSLPCLSLLFLFFSLLSQDASVVRWRVCVCVSQDNIVNTVTERRECLASNLQ